MVLILWFKHLPPVQLDDSKWHPFLKYDFTRAHFMKFVYAFQIFVILIPNFYNEWFPSLSLLTLIVISIVSFILHECLHIITIYHKGDLSLTFHGVFFWIQTNSPLSKLHFFTFMGLPFFGLTVLPFIASFFVHESLQSILLYISWFNTITSGSDILNLCLIAFKPNKAIFCRGFYKVNFNQ